MFIDFYFETFWIFWLSIATLILVIFISLIEYQHLIDVHNKLKEIKDKVYVIDEKITNDLAVKKKNRRKKE